MNRFSLPREEPQSPARKGSFIIEEAWLGFHNGDFCFYSKPAFAAVMVQLRFDYFISANETEPFVRSIHWRSPGEDFWDLIYLEFATQYLHFAAERFLEEGEIAKRFERWIGEHSEEVPPDPIENVFKRELEAA